MCLTQIVNIKGSVNTLHFINRKIYLGKSLMAFHVVKVNRIFLPPIATRPILRVHTYG